MIDLKLVAALRAILKTGTFQKAALSLHISQSAVSQRVHSLEEQQGAPVLVRSSPPRATALGQRLVLHLQRVEQLELETGLAGGGSIHPVASMAVNADSLATWFADALEFSGLDLLADIVIADQDTGLARMRNGEVLACLCSDAQPAGGARADLVGVMKYRAYASRSFIARHGLADHLDRLCRTPCLVYDQDDTLQHRYLALLGQPPPDYRAYCPSSEGFVRMLAAGQGFGLAPDQQIAELDPARRPVDLAPGQCIDVPLYWHSWRSSSKLMKDLRDGIVKFGRQVLYQPA